VIGEGFDLSETHVHLGLGSRAVPIADFRWTPEFLERYASDFSSDGAEGRLVMVGGSSSSWTFWERHPAGDELVVVLSGRVTLVQEHDREPVEERRSGADDQAMRTETTQTAHTVRTIRTVQIPLSAGEAAINPRGTWHTTDVEEPARILFITPGMGTEHRSREQG
jgi:uncharacterized cupin superfamily protein